MTIDLPAPSPLARLREGSEEPPIFMAHGLGANAAQLLPLAGHIDVPHSIYGIEYLGSDGTTKPLSSIEGMARFYRDAIKQVQPVGPYFLIGYSLGGLVAFEMARQLAQTPGDIGLLLMVDSYPHLLALTLGQQVRLVCRRAGRGTRAALGFGHRPLSTRPPDAPAAAGNREVREAAELALKRYRPSYYGGAVKFIRASAASVFPEDPVAVWAPLAAGFSMETVPGDHVEMITGHVKILASAVSRHLTGALRGQ